jgi:hypothetical protein
VQILNEDDLRDCFAMFAMNGYVSNMGFNPQAHGGICKDGETNAEAVARSCYEMADAMMEARKPKDEAGIASVKRTRKVK